MEAQCVVEIIPAQELLGRDYFVLINLICVDWTPGFGPYHCGFRHNGQCAFKAVAKCSCAAVTKLHLVPGFHKEDYMHTNTDMHTLTTQIQRVADTLVLKQFLSSNLITDALR